MSEQTISDDDRGYLYGDGLFETVRVRDDGSIRWLGRHVQRLEASGQYFGFEHAQIADACDVLRSFEGRKAGLWRLTVTRDSESAPFGGNGSIRERFREYHERERPALGLLRGWYLPDDELAEHKTTSYLRSVEQLRRARRTGYDDAIALSHDGRLGECAWANIVLVRSGKAFTPEVKGLLPGVTRRGVLALYDMPVTETSVTTHMLEDADEIALLSAGVGALAAKSIEGRALSCAWTDRLTAWLDEVGR
jgi:branched-subunit amino acid aminotransferase/4-amino-4-deoxychorismate lyase